MMDIQEDGSIALRGTSSPWAAEVESLKRHKKKKSSKEDRAGRRIAKGMRRLKDTNEELSKSLNTSKQLRQVSFRNSHVLNERNSSEESPGKIIRQGIKNTIDWDSNTDGLLKDDVSPVRSVRKKTRKLKENVDDSISPVGNVKKKSRTLKENIDDSISPVRSARKKSRKLKENVDDSVSPVRSERKKSRKLKENIDDSVSPVRSERKISRKLKENIDESISPVRSERKITRKLKENVDSISPVGSARKKSRKLKENVDDSISSVRKSIKTKENIECTDSSQSPELKRIQSFLRKFDESLLSPVALDNESLPVFENSLMRNTRKVDLLANESNFQTPPSQRILRSSMCGSGRQSRNGSAFKKSIIKTPYRSQVFENETPESVEECVDCDADDVTVQNTKKNKTRCSVICISDDSISETSAKSKNRKSKRVMVLENNHKSRIIEERNKSKKLRASKSALQEDHFSISDVSSSDSNERPVKRKSRKIRKSKRASLENARKSWVISVSDSADEGAREGGREAGFDVESAEKSSEEDFETSGAKNSAVTKGTEKHAGNGIFEMEADFDDETSKKSKDRTFEIEDVKTSKLKKRTSGIEENSEDIADKTSKSRRRTSEIEEDSTNIAVKKSKSKKRISETEKNSADVDVKASKSTKRTSNIQENSADIVDKASKSKVRTFEIEEDCANIALKSKKRTSEIEENSADTKTKNNTSEIEENSAYTKSKNNTFEIEDNSADIEVKTFKSKKRNTKIVENCANVDFSTSKSKNRTFEIEEDSAIDVKTSSLRSSKIEENSPDIDFKASKSKNTTFEIEDDSANIDVKTAKTKKRISKIEDNSADIDVRRSISKASKKDLNNRTFEKEAISENKNDTFEIETSDNKKADEKNDTFEIQDVNNETADENGTFDVNDKETKLKPDSIGAKNKTIDKNSTFEVDSTAANNKTIDKNGTFEIDTNVSRKNSFGVKKPKKRNSYDNNHVQKIAEHPPKKSPRLNVKTTPVNRRSNKMNKTKSPAVIVKRRTLENAKTEKSDSINKNVKQTEIINQDCENFDSKRLDAFENVIGDEKSDNQDRTSEIGPKVKTSAISFKESTCEISPEKKTNEIGPEKRRTFEFSPSSSNNVGMKRGCNEDDEPAIPQTMSNFKDTSILSITDSPASNAKRRKRWDVASSPWKNDLKNLSPKEKLFQKPKPLTPIVLDKINATKSTSQVKKSANKVPNYALIHQRAFAKMESVDDYMERKKARAEALRSGTKVKVGILKETPNKTPRSMKQLFPTSTTKLQENKTGNVNLLPAKAATPGKTPNALKIQDNVKSRCNAQLFTSTPNETDKLVGISKMKASRLPRLSNPKNKSNSQLRTADKVEAQSLKNTSKSVSNKSSVKNLSGLKFKSKLLTPKKFVFTQKKTSPVKRKPLPAKEVRIEEVKAVINKTRANIQNPANNRREYIKGVRSNKRFDLLMSMRKMD